MQNNEWMFRIPVIQKRYLASGSILTECITLTPIGKQDVYVYHGEDFDFSEIDLANILNYRTFFLISADSPTNALAIFYAESDSLWVSKHERDKATTLDSERPIIQLPPCPNLVITEINLIFFCLKYKKCDEEGDLEYSDCYLFRRNLQAQTWCKIAEFMEKIRRDGKRGKLKYEMVDDLCYIPFRS